MTKSKRIEDSYFDRSINQDSPVMAEKKFVVNKDEDGNEFYTWEPFDSAAYQKSLGTVDNWTLETLLRAGVNPDFPVHTGYNTRLEGLNVLEGAVDYAEKLIEENNNE